MPLLKSLAVKSFAVLVFLSIGACTEEKLVLTPCCTDLSRETRPFGGKYLGPLVDTHAHLTGGLPSPAYIRKMADAINSGLVDGLALMPTPNYGRRASHLAEVKIIKVLNAKTDGRVKALCGANYLNVWLAKAATEEYQQQTLEELRFRLTEDMKDADCIGLGEIAIRHFDKYASDDPRTQHVLVVPYEFPPLHSFLSIANKAAKPIDLHSEPMTQWGQSYEDQWISEIEDLAARYPNSPLILSHTAMTRPENLRRIFKRYPNIYSNIKLIRRRWINLETPNDIQTKELYGDWAALMEEMPDRFMIGSDFKFNKWNRNLKRKGMDSYARTIGQYREILGSLSPGVAEAIAYKNARRIFGFQVRP